MTRKLTFLILAMMFALMIPSAPTWGAEGDTHDFTQSTSQLLNNNATIAPISIPDQGYPVKQVNITCRYNKAIDPAVTINIAIGADNSWGTTTVGNIFNGTKQISGTSTPGNITISFTNNCGSGTGKGTFYVTNVQLVEGPAGSTPSITVNPSTITWDNSPINVQLSKTITVSQANLEEGITIASTIGAVNPSTIAAGGDATDVILTYTPTTTGDFEGTITFTSDETSATVSVTGSAYDPSQVDTYTKVNSIADLTADDVFIIVGNNGSNYAMSNNNGTSSAPTAVAVTVTDDVITNPANTILWTISGNATDGYIFYPYGSTTTWLYCTDANNGLRVGNTTDSQDHRTFSIKDSYIFNNSRNRYLGIYSNSDWRSYTSINTNITGQTFAFYKKGGTPSTVATPTFTPAGGTYATAQNVTISCATEGASIYYTLDGTTPTDASTRYTSAITVSETTTVKAIAYVGNEASNVATATYTILTPLTTMDEIFDAATEADSDATDILVTFDNWVISGVKSSNAYLTDNDGKGLIIYTSSHGFEVGDILSGTAACKVQLYNGSAELTNLTATTSGLTVTEGGSVIAQEVSIADLSGVNTGAVIKVNNVQYNGTNLVDENSNIIKPYNAVDYNPTFTNGLKYNVTGVYIQFNTTKEIAPRSADDIEEIVPTEPSITVAETLELPYTESEETLEVIYQNIDFDNIDINLYDDAECTTDFTGDWFIAEFDDQFNIEYLADENTESTTRTVYMQINYNESELTKVITVTQEAAPQTYNVTLSSNGVVGEPQPVQGSITLSDPTNIPTEFTFAGWTESESNIQFVANPYTPTSNVILYAVFSRVEGGIAGSGNYEKVTSALTDWRGDYLIAYSDEVFMNGSLAGGTDGVGAANSSVAPETALTANTITAAWGDQYYVTIEAIDDNDLSKGYVIKSHSETTPYFYQTSNTNGMANTNNKTTAAAYPINIVFNNENDIDIALGGAAIGAVLHYNATGTGHMFRFYKNGAQENIYLYKKAAGTPGTTHYYTRVYDENTTLGSLEVTGPSIILSDYTLTVTGSMSNENPANLVIEDGAQLYYTNGENVNATFQKNITGYTGDNDNYYLIAAPIADASIEGLTTNEYDLFSYDEPTHYWFNQKGTDNPFNTLSLGQGYLYANSTTGNVTISGIISNEQDPTIAVTASASNLTGFNLVGNPFTYNLNIGNMAMMDNTDIYYITSIYQIVGTAIVASQNTSIAPCEGFFIQAPAAGELFFNAESSRSEKSPVSDLKVEVKEATRSAQLIDRAYVNFSESRPMNKFYLNENSTRLYIPQNGEDYAVVMASAAEGELPMNFKAEKNGSYTITVDTENVDAEYLHLIDNMTGMDVDLLSTPSYTFEAKTSDYASRFKLVFGVNNTASESSDSNFAYMSDGNLVISDIEGEATLQIVDELGRVISTETVSGSYNKALNLKAGLYILNLNGMTQKIVVK